MRKRFYILFVTRDANGELRKIHIPLHYMYVFLAGTILGMLTITGIAGSYTRMALKVTRFNQLRSEQQQLKTRYERLEKAAQEKDIQVASLGLLASEVSTLYGLKTEPALADPRDFTQQQLDSSIDQLHALKRSALTGGTTLGLSMRVNRQATIADWLKLSQAPTLWPVEGRITGAFGERIDPFNGEGAFHRGVDISSAYGHAIIAPADGTVMFADFMSGYGRMIVIDHGYGISTRYGHMSSFAVAEGQSVKRGDIIGYVGMSGRSTGPHLHYEVWLHDTPVNPYRYLRVTSAKMHRTSGAD